MYSNTINELDNERVLTAQESYDLIKSNPDIQIIDARDDEMFRSGYIKGAINIDAFDCKQLAKLSEFDVTKQYLIYCTTDIRSKKIISLMIQMGFRDLYMMRSGIVEWKAFALPLQYDLVE
jgi:rhodanese-related sulfurtransferase